VTVALPSIPNVTLGEEIGAGAFGSVHRGRHRALDIDVAVKIVRPRGASEVDRLLYEARLMARLDHPNLLRIHDAGAFDDGVYMVLELMDGGSLDDVHAVDAARLERTTRDLLSGLQALHEARVLHRDIKPANCLVRRADGRVKLADLGIAIEHATTDAGERNLAGTIVFMAPELFLEHPPPYSARTDVYALGMTLLLVTLPTPPFPDGTQVVAWASSGPRPDVRALRPDVPPHLASLLLRMIAARPEDRPESASAALRSLLEPRAIVPAVRSEPSERMGPWVLGAEVQSNANWRVSAVTHKKTGLSARLAHLQPKGPLARAGARVTEAAALASSLEHPGIATVVDWGEADGRVYVVTAAEGQTLDAIVRSSSPLDEAHALRVTSAIANALAYMHGRGLVYQVMGPGSVNAGADGESVHLSWPLFCVQTGTEGYKRIIFAIDAAPEALSLEGTIEPPVDVYALGETLYFLLTGHHPFEARADDLVAAKALAPPPVRAFASDVTQPTIDLVHALMSVDPALRPTAIAASERAAQIARRLGDPIVTARTVAR
jgi:serine/threonine protein kinase